MAVSFLQIICSVLRHLARGGSCGVLREPRQIHALLSNRGYEPSRDLNDGPPQQAKVTCSAATRPWPEYPSNEPLAGSALRTFCFFVLKVGKEACLCFQESPGLKLSLIIFVCFMFFDNTAAKVTIKI